MDSIQKINTIPVVKDIIQPPPKKITKPLSYPVRVDYQEYLGLGIPQGTIDYYA